MTRPGTDEAPFCAHCGRSETGYDHRDCQEKLSLEPPRFCVDCDRRMRVQVTPRGWSAECVEHGVLIG